jgi:hypothetical protein
MSQVVKLKAVALFSGIFPNLPAECRPRIRFHRNGYRSTQTACRLEEEKGRTFAVPMLVPSDAVSTPRFRLQLHVVRPQAPPVAVALALQASRDSNVKDPEHRIIFPHLKGPETSDLRFQSR